MSTPGESATPLTDAEKLRALALWFDIYDTDREQARLILRESGNRDEVQRDLRRIADEIDERNRE
jgi:hypothetical protein